MLHLLPRRQAHRLILLAGVLSLVILIFHTPFHIIAVLSHGYLISPFFPPTILGRSSSSPATSHVSLVKSPRAASEPAAFAAAFDLETLQPPAGAPIVVPRRIHQVRLGGNGFEMRPAWREARESCMALMPPSNGSLAATAFDSGHLVVESLSAVDDAAGNRGAASAGDLWEYTLWTDESGDAFVKEYYPQLFSTYRGYRQEIQRSNILRYLVLHHYGGIYLDLDLRCLKPLDAFLTVPFLTPPANPIGVNNAFIIASPGHPFFTRLLNNIVRFDMQWFSPYVTNMFSTGCHFFSSMHSTSPSEIHRQLFVLPDSYKLNGHVTTPIFEHLGASSWHKGDARLILQLGKLIERFKSSGSHWFLGAISWIGGMVAGLAWTQLVIRRAHAREAAREEKRARRAERALTLLARGLEEGHGGTIAVPVHQISVDLGARDYREMRGVQERERGEAIAFLPPRANSLPIAVSGPRDL